MYNSSPKADIFFAPLVLFLHLFFSVTTRVSSSLLLFVPHLLHKMRQAIRRSTRFPRPQPPRRSLASATTTFTPAPPPLEVTTLPNGVRVATDSSPGHFVAAGVYIDAGSRFESSRTRGAAHMIDRLGFKVRAHPTFFFSQTKLTSLTQSTTNRTTEQMTSEIEALGQQFMSAAARDTMIYQASTYTRSLPAVVSILSDTILNPLITPEELDAERDAAAWEISEINNKPELILPELLHAVAYKDNTLGHSLLCPEDRLETITPEIVKEFLATWYRPERTVIAAAGVPHQELLELAEKHFGQMKTQPVSAPPPTTPSRLSASKSTLLKPLSTSATAAASIIPGYPVSSSTPPPPETFESLSTATARYTGGELYLDKPDMDFVHIYVGYEGLPVLDKDIYVLATLHMLLGGGHSFSAGTFGHLTFLNLVSNYSIPNPLGGPGKGMYSRLYTHVLNQHHKIDYCQSFHHIYTDSSLFGIALATEPSYVTNAVYTLTNQLDSVTGPSRGGIDQGGLERAKNQLKSALAMSLESRLTQVEDLGVSFVHFF